MSDSEHPAVAAENRFLWGVATSAYQSEGGYNGPGQPQTNWARAEREGRVQPLGKAAQFWTRYREDFAASESIGLTAFRLGVEWSRVQPTLADAPSDPPDFDTEALDGYADMLLDCREHRLEPVLTLHHFVHPAWLGPDAWLSPTTVEHFDRYVRTAVGHINRALIRRHQPPVRYYITVNEPNMLVLNTYLGHQFPGGSNKGLRHAARALCNLLRAHVRAYRSIHELYGSEGWPAPKVTLNSYCSDLYWLDKLLLDLLAVRERGIEPAGIQAYVHEQRRAFDAAIRGAEIPLRKDLAYGFGSLFKAACAWLGRKAFDARDFECLWDSLYTTPGATVMDYLALDYYDPFTAHTFRLPSIRDHEFRNKSFHSWAMNSVTCKWWDWRVLPRGLHFFCSHYSADFSNRPVLIAENGMALQRRVDNAATHRRDRMTRSEFLELHVNEVERMRREGLPLIGYLHWSLFDNYEWGTFTPRFGLYSLDYTRGTERIAIDQQGDRPVDTYRALIIDADGMGARQA